MIHWPVAFSNSTEPGKNLFPQTKKGSVDIDTETSLVETWKALIDLQKICKVKTIGVSNFTIEQIQGIADATGVWPVRLFYFQAPMDPSCCCYVGCEPDRGAPPAAAGRVGRVFQEAQHPYHRIQPARQQSRRQAEAD